MALYWCTECIPLSVTALLPVILFPMMGIMQSSEVFPTVYMHFKNSVFYHINYFCVMKHTVTVLSFCDPFIFKILYLKNKSSTVFSYVTKLNELHIFKKITPFTNFRDNCFFPCFYLIQNYEQIELNSEVPEVKMPFIFCIEILIIDHNVVTIQSRLNTS